MERYKYSKEKIECKKVAELKACNPSCEFGVIVITSASLQKDLTGTGYWVDHYNVYLDLVRGYKECGSLKYSAFIPPKLNIRQKNAEMKTFVGKSSEF